MYRLLYRERRNNPTNLQQGKSSAFPESLNQSTVQGAAPAVPGVLGAHSG